MTGFARAQGADAAVTWVWEARSVNGRGLEVRGRVPTGLEALDQAAREAAAKRFKRGNVNLTLTVQRTAAAGEVRINEALLEQLLALRAKFPQLGTPSFDGMLAVRGVIEVAEAAEDEAMVAAREAAMLATLGGALDALAAMRAEEGRRLDQILRGQLDSIEALVAQAGQTAAARPEALKERLRAGVAALLEANVPLPEDRLAQELALLVSRTDVREELDRLGAHIAAARDMLAAGGPIGRKLDFLCQEFNREANTLCSKSQDVELTRVGLDLKAVIEQFREQVQNIE